MGADPFFLEARPTFAMAAVVVATVAAVAIVVGVGCVRFSERQLAGMRQALQAGSYRRFIGATEEEIFAETRHALPFRPRLLILVSSQCRACEALLQHVAATDWALPTAVAWLDPPPEAARGDRKRLVVLDNGRRLAERLDVNVLPFALVFDRDGSVVYAAPVNALQSLTDWAVRGS